MAASTVPSNFNLNVTPYKTEDLDGTEDITTRCIFVAPCNATIQGARISTEATTTTCNATNTIAVSILVAKADQSPAVTGGGNATIASRTFTSNLTADTQYEITLTQALDVAKDAEILLTLTNTNATSLNTANIFIIWNAAGLAAGMTGL